MTDHIEELRKRGMITSLAKVPVSKTDGIICAATLADAAADPALTLDIARELLREAAEAIRCLHQYRERKKSMTDHIEVLRGLEKEWQEYVDKHDGGYSHVEGVKKCLSELRAALAALGGEQGWRPIETALSLLSEIMDYPLAMLNSLDQDERCVTKAEAVAAITRALESAQQPAAVDGDVAWIRLRGSQGEPAGTMTVTAELQDGSEVVLIRDSGNEIDHAVNLAAALAAQPGGSDNDR